MISPLVFSGESKYPVIVTEQSASTQPSSMELLDDTRLLKIGDRISLSIVQDEGMKYNLLVQDDGTVNCPQLGPIKAAGITMKKLAYAVKR